MPCYICFEEDDTLMQTNNCSCKGSIVIHQSCFIELMNNTKNPFQCSVCKSDYSAPFLKKFFSEEEILMHSMGQEQEEEEQQVVYQYVLPGIPIMISNEEVVFKSKKHKSLVLRSLFKEMKAVKLESIHRQKSLFKQSLNRRLNRRLKLI